MSLVRCLGPLRLPRSYTQFMRADLEHCKAMRTKGVYGDEWNQYPLGDDAEEDWRSGLIIPGRDAALFHKKLSGIISGPQFHSIMSLVSCVEHTDNDDDFKQTSFLIPYRIGPCHFLEVEGERHSMKPMHIYAFNQLRPHRLVYATRVGNGFDEFESYRSKVASILNVCFYKKGLK
jgi:hypothetical protein